MGSVVITGPPGSGKTTVCRLLAERSPRGVHLDADHFWHMIASGYVEPWEPESSTQNVIVIDAVAAAAVEYAAGGYDVFIDGILGPWHLAPLAQRYHDAGIRLAYVVLYPPIEAALARASSRGEGGLFDKALSATCTSSSPEAADSRATSSTTASSTHSRRLT